MVKNNNIYCDKHNKYVCKTDDESVRIAGQDKKTIFYSSGGISTAYCRDCTNEILKGYKKTDTENVNDYTKYSAFPVFDSRRVDSDYECIDCDMTLRDYFAGQALAGLLSSAQIGYIRTSSEVNNESKEYAKSSYILADAMMEARQK